MLFTELFDSELVHGGGHVLDRLLQVLGVTLHQRLGDATPAMLGERREERDIKHDYIERFKHLNHIEQHKSTVFKRTGQYVRKRCSRVDNQ